MHLRPLISSLALLAAACSDASPPANDRSPSTSEAGESSSETGAPPEGLQPFVPNICGSWNPPPATPAGSLPPEQACADAGPCPVFTEVAEQAGLGTVQFVETKVSEYECILPRPIEGGLLPHEGCDAQWNSGGATVGDVDNDGWPDILMTRLAAPDHLFLNQGDGTFVDVAEQVGLGACSWTNGAMLGDIDNDGDLDVLRSTIGDAVYELWINQLADSGELTFVEEGEARGFALPTSELHAGQSIALGDVDRDGWLDVHIDEWLRVELIPGDPADISSHTHGPRLLHNLGGGSFEDLTLAAGVGPDLVAELGSFSFATAFVDVDGDGWQELARTVDYGLSRLYWNDGAGFSYTDGTELAGVNRETSAMGSTFADVDLDGDLDWFVTAIAEARTCEDDESPPCWMSSGNRLYRYSADRVFGYLTDKAAVRDGDWAWGASFFDADNDGDPDLALTNGWPGRDLKGGKSLTDTPTRLWMHTGLEAFGDPELKVMREEGEARGFHDEGQGRALLSFDYDRDGDLDLLLVNHAGPLRLFRNDGGNRNPWLRVALEGAVSNHDARGAKLRVQVEPDGTWQVREVGVGSHFLGEGERVQHFGLGADFELGVDTVHQLIVEWPASGLVQDFAELEGGQRYSLVEGEDLVVQP